MATQIKQRLKLYERDGWRCHYCQREVLCGVALWHPLFATLDHKHPRSRGGGNDSDNLVTCCRRCNAEKANMPYEMYLWYRHMIMRGHDRDELVAAIANVIAAQEFAPVAQPVEARP